MSFVRVKRILNKKTGKRYPYAYIVSNSWKGNKVKQKVKKYLGSVHYFERKDVSFEKFINMGMNNYLDIKNKKEIIMDLVRWELCNHGFVSEGKCLVNAQCCFDTIKNKLHNNRGKHIAVASNDGILCSYLIKKILKFDYDGTEQDIMYNFAKDFVELGISIPHDVFIALYEKVF